MLFLVPFFIVNEVLSDRPELLFFVLSFDQIHQTITSWFYRLFSKQTLSVQVKVDYFVGSRFHHEDRVRQLAEIEEELLIRPLPTIITSVQVPPKSVVDVGEDQVNSCE